MWEFEAGSGCAWLSLGGQVTHLVQPLPLDPQDPAKGPVSFTPLQHCPWLSWQLPRLAWGPPGGLQDHLAGSTTQPGPTLLWDPIVHPPWRSEALPGGVRVLWGTQSPQPLSCAPVWLLPGVSPVMTCGVPTVIPLSSSLWWHHHLYGDTLWCSDVSCRPELYMYTYIYLLI